MISIPHILPIAVKQQISIRIAHDGTGLIGVNWYICQYRRRLRIEIQPHAVAEEPEVAFLAGGAYRNLCL